MSMFRKSAGVLFTIAAMAAVSLTAKPVPAQTAGDGKELLFSHHLPENPDDWRYIYPMMFAEEVAKANVGLKVTVYPNQKLMRAKEQWGALSKGTIHFSMFSLAELAEGVPEVQALGLPAVIRDVSHAVRATSSPFMAKLRELVGRQGILVYEGAWMAGAVGTAKECISTPADLMGLAARTSSKALDALFEGAGALAVPLPSSEITRGLTTGAIDAITLPVASFVSSNIRSEIKCLTLPGEGTLFFTYAPIVASKQGLADLTEAQRTAVSTAAHNAAVRTQALIDKLDAQAEATFTKAGVQVRRLDAKSFAAWQAEAERTSYVTFLKSSPEAAEVLNLMKAVP